MHAHAWMYLLVCTCAVTLLFFSIVRFRLCRVSCSTCCIPWPISSNSFFYEANCLLSTHVSHIPCFHTCVLVVSQLDSKQWGIETLVRRIVELQMERVSAFTPGLRDKIKEKIKEIEKQLNKLPPRRACDTPSGQHGSIIPYRYLSISLPFFVHVLVLFLAYFADRHCLGLLFSYGYAQLILLYSQWWFPAFLS